MACIGLVPEYTTEAGRLAALGAGAKVVGSFSYEMTKSELRELEELSPDIVLLTGGTDGGNKRTILHNASLLAKSERIRNIIVAGNKSAGDELREAFDGSGQNVAFTENVMPEFGRLNIEPVNAVIRELFISRITEAKGVDKARQRIGDVVMPTPSAVLAGARVLADGTYGEAGLGPLMVVDVGGATTDVYSVAEGVPRSPMPSAAWRETWGCSTTWTLWFPWPPRSIWNFRGARAGRKCSRACGRCWAFLPGAPRPGTSCC